MLDSLTSVAAQATEVKFFREKIQEIYKKTLLHGHAFDSEELDSIIDSKKVVASFYAQKNLHEIEPPHFSQEKKMLYPKCSDNKELLFFHMKENEEAQLNTQYGVYEATQKDKSSEDPDCIFLPALAVDREGNRIGRGAGFYDRYLRKKPQILSCAIIHSSYLFEKLSKSFFHEHDEKVDLILTEKSLHIINKEKLS